MGEVVLVLEQVEETSSLLVPQVMVVCRERLSQLQLRLLKGLVTSLTVLLEFQITFKKQARHRRQYISRVCD